MDKPVSFYAFEMLYWCGIRLGELLALTPEDFDFQNRKLRINKSYQRIKGKDVITDPKTKKSNRTIEMPDFLCEEMQDYLRMLYDQKSDERIFTISKSYLHHEMDRGVKETGLKRIRIHDLRHSHVSLLIELGFSAVAIADRVGHESIEITYRYMLFIDPYNGYTGGCFDAENSNDYQSTQQYMWIPKEHNVQVQFNALSDVRIETNGDKCTLSVTGGDIEITYVSELVYDQDGALIEKNETTVHAQHNFKAVHELPEGYIEK